jgi:hypothetical protein
MDSLTGESAVADILWNLSSIYPSPESEDYRSDKDELVSLSAMVIALLDDVHAGGLEAGAWLPEAVIALNRLTDLSENLTSYVYAIWTVDTADESAQAEIDDL